MTLLRTGGRRLGCAHANKSGQVVGFCYRRREHRRRRRFGLLCRAAGAGSAGDQWRLDRQPDRSGSMASLAQCRRPAVAGVSLLESVRATVSLPRRRLMRGSGPSKRRSRWLWLASIVIALLLLFPLYVCWFSVG